jgi:hypothetical protein
MAAADSCHGWLCRIDHGVDTGHPEYAERGRCGNVCSNTCKHAKWVGYCNITVNRYGYPVDRGDGDEYSSRGGTRSQRDVSERLARFQL